MSNKTEEKPVSDEEMSRRLRFLEEVDATTADKVTSWADLYECLKGHIYAYFESPSQTRAEISLALMMAFVMALEEMPEEGDAKVLLKRTNRILIVEQERTGLAFDIRPPSETKDTKGALAAALALLLGAVAPQDGPDEEIPADRTLH